MVLNYFTFRSEDFICPACGWSGKGSALIEADFSELHWICSLECPSCYSSMGSWQSPTKEEVEQWKKNNPGVKTGWDRLNNANQ